MMISDAGRNALLSLHVAHWREVAHMKKITVIELLIMIVVVIYFCGSGG